MELLALTFMNCRIGGMTTLFVMCLGCAGGPGDESLASLADGQAPRPDASPAADAWRDTCDVDIAGTIVGQTPWGPVELAVTNAVASGGCWAPYPFTITVTAEDSNLRHLELSFTLEELAPTEFHGEGWSIWMDGQPEVVALDVKVGTLEMDSWADCSNGSPYEIDMTISAVGPGWHIKDALIQGSFCQWWRNVCADAPKPRCI